jgi:hypothetical protein
MGNAQGSFIVFLVTLIGATLVLIVKAPNRWLTAVYDTVCVFGGMTLFFKVRWRYSRFWFIIAAAFLVHLGLIWQVFAIFLRDQADVSLGICLPFIFLEAAALYYSVRFWERKLPGQSGRAVKKGF